MFRHKNLIYSYTPQLFRPVLQYIRQISSSQLLSPYALTSHANWSLISYIVDFQSSISPLVIFFCIRHDSYPLPFQISHMFRYVCLLQKSLLIQFRIHFPEVSKFILPVAASISCSIRQIPSKFLNCILKVTFQTLS